MKLLGKVKNGNYTISIYDDGTKIRENDLDFFEPEYPESMDIKITNKCDMGCAFCHEDSKESGDHGNIMNLKFIETLLPYTELAIGGGNALTHPDLIPFLEKCKTLKLIPNMTVNQIHFMKEQKLIRYLVDNKLIYGLGISLVTPTDSFIKLAKRYDNAVIHIINGVQPLEDLEKLYANNFKLLILGYKEFRRGADYYSDEIKTKKNKMYEILPEFVKHFKVVSFDNLAVKQLDARRLLTDAEWKEYFLGEDGTHTMYIDCVKQEYAVSSTSTTRMKLLDDIRPMFNNVKEISHDNKRES